ncbi:Kinase [Caenorhabditis elegans]|uniref:Kinase n=1 Tax=Caenorhabditis elegans TaxID=6239 RepID=O62519_CAEEL|nr:Kinase [Caenorhabditis elegans]CAB05842.3 Kinase [Caenorhabditis elegans]|eukprot:NP_502402.3 Kinase [Caenorhabditis elegans]
MSVLSNDGLPEKYQWFSDQIAGHHPSVIKNGKREIGLLKIPGSREILKPKQDASRGEKEVALYELLRSCTTSPSTPPESTTSDELRKRVRMEDIEMLCKLTADFYGIQTIFVDGQDREFLAMEDVTIGYQRPAILDLKMGQVTYDPIAKPEKIEKERIKYPPQAKMGMRILGYRIHRSDNQVEVRDKDWGKSFDETTVETGLREFFSARSEADLNQVLLEALDKLKIIKNFFETQRSLQFFASSLLFVFEADKELPINMRIVMIDFSHAFASSGEPDNGYSLGIQNLEKFLNNIISS